MLCSRLLKAASRRAAQRLLSCVRRRLQRALPRLPVGAPQGDGVAAGDALRHRSCRWRASGYLFAVVPKGFFPQRGHRPDRRLHRGGAGHLVQMRWASIQQAVAQVIKDDPNVADVNAAIGAVNSSPSLNVGRLFIQLKPREQRKLSADEVIQELRPKLAQHHRHQDLHAEPAEHQSRRTAGQERLSVHAPGQRHDGALPLRRDHGGPHRAASGRAGRQFRSPAS